MFSEMQCPFRCSRMLFRSSSQEFQVPARKLLPTHPFAFLQSLILSRQFLFRTGLFPLVLLVSPNLLSVPYSAARFPAANFRFLFVLRFQIVRFPARLYPLEDFQTVRFQTVLLQVALFQVAQSVPSLHFHSAQPLQLRFPSALLQLALFQSVLPQIVLSLPVPSSLLRFVRILPHFLRSKHFRFRSQRLSRRNIVRRLAARQPQSQLHSPRHHLLRHRNHRRNRRLLRNTAESAFRRSAASAP